MIANWIRAYSIVMIGHVTGSPMILGVEHTTYGWFLFGAVVMVMFWVGGRWVEESPRDDSTVAPVSPGELPRQPSNGGVLVAIVLLLAGAHGWAWSLQQGAPSPVPQIQLPEALGDWRADPGHTSLDWTHGFLNPSSTSFRAYAREQTQVQVWIGYYGLQSADSKLVTSMHRVVSNDGPKWRSLATGVRQASVVLPAFSTHVVSPGAVPGLGATEAQRVWYLYWLEGRWFIRPSEVKLRQAFSRLLGHADDGAVVMLVTPLSDGADTIMEKFAREHLDAIGAALGTTRQSRELETVKKERE